MYMELGVIECCFYVLSFFFSDDDGLKKCTFLYDQTFILLQVQWARLDDLSPHKDRMCQGEGATWE